MRVPPLGESYPADEVPIDPVRGAVVSVRVPPLGESYVELRGVELRGLEVAVDSDWPIVP